LCGVLNRAIGLNHNVSRGFFPFSEQALLLYRLILEQADHEELPPQRSKRGKPNNPKDVICSTACERMRREFLLLP